MSKTLDQLTFDEILKDNIRFAFEQFSDLYDHKTYECNGTEYITERSALKCAESFKNEFDITDFVNNYLLENKDFCQKVFELLDKEI